MKQRRKEPKHPSLRINVYILEKMKKEGILSILDLSRRSGVGQPTLNGLISSRISSRTKRGEWRKEVMSLAIFFECQPGALFGFEGDSNACDDGRIQAEACFSHTRSSVLLACAEVLQPERALFMSELSRRQEDILTGLTLQEKRTISLYFGFDGKGERTLGEVGEELGISRPRVGQLKTNAFEKLQRKSKLKALYAGE
mgnify:CR=1 FL=1